MFVLKSLILAALSINPKLGSAHTAIAFVKHFYSYDWEFAEKSYKKESEQEDKQKRQPRAKVKATTRMQSVSARGN